MNIIAKTLLALSTAVSFTIGGLVGWIIQNLDLMTFLQLVISLPLLVSVILLIILFPFFVLGSYQENLQRFMVEVESIKEVKPYKFFIMILFASNIAGLIFPQVSLSVAGIMFLFFLVHKTAIFSMNPLYAIAGYRVYKLNDSVYYLVDDEVEESESVEVVIPIKDKVVIHWV